MPLGLNLGVPQGSVLGPILFLIYINYLPYYMTNILIKFFADDTLVFASEYLDELIAKRKHGIRTLLEWCSYNYL